MNDKKDTEKKISNFLFEIGTMRKLPRMHRQVLLTDDMSDNIASHSYRVAMIGWFLAKMENVDPYKVTMMCLLHDLDEARSGDHNWLHKRYVKIYDDEISKDQLSDLPFPDLYEFQEEYAERESREAIVAKDADLLDQILLLREYEWAGNTEAKLWLYGRGGGNKYVQVDNLRLDSSKEIGRAIYENSPSDWWDGLATGKNR